MIVLTMRHSVVYRYLTPMRRDYAEGMRLLQSLVEDRREETIMHQPNAEWPDKQVCLLLILW